MSEVRTGLYRDGLVQGLRPHYLRVGQGILGRCRRILTTALTRSAGGDAQRPGHTIFLLSRYQRQSEEEHGTATGARARPDASGLRLHEKLANSETYSCPANFR